MASDDLRVSPELKTQFLKAVESDMTALFPSFQPLLSVSLNAVRTTPVPPDCAPRGSFKRVCRECGRAAGGGGGCGRRR